MSVQVGTRLGQYVVGARVSSTGSSEWFEAAEAGLERHVSVVVAPLSEDAAAVADARERARKLAGLSDAKLLPIYGQGEDGGMLWLATRRVVGHRLSDLGRIEERRAARLGAQLAGQLAALHEAGVAPAAIEAGDVVVERLGDQELAWLMPDPSRPVAPDASATTRSLVELLDHLVGRPLVAVAPSDPETLADLLAGQVASGRSRKRLGLAVSAVLVAALVAGLIALTRHHAQQKAGAPAAASSPVARVVARIPLGESVGSVSLNSTAVWVGTVDGTALLVDPERNQVVGAPLRVGAKKAYVAVALAGSTLWAAANATLVRVDATQRRITARTSLPSSSIAYSDDASRGVVWVTAVIPKRQATRALRFDATTRRLTGRSPALDGGASIVRITSNGAWTVSGAGEFSRLSAGGKTVATIYVGESAYQANSAFGRVWIPTVPDRTVAIVDPRNLTYKRALRFPADTLAVTHLDGSIWVLTQNPSRIYRIDPKTLAFLGAPMVAPKGASVLVAGAGSLWVDDPNDHTLLRLAPTKPAAASVPMPVSSSGALQNGPVPVGKRFTLTGRDWRFSVETQDPGWLGAYLANTGPGQGAIYDIHHLQVGLNWIELKQLFDASGRIVPLKRPNDLVSSLRRNTNVRVVSVGKILLGGVRGVRVVVDVRPRVPYPKACGTTPCAVIAPLNGLTYTITPGRTEFTLVQRGAKLLVFNLNLAEHPDAQVVARSHRLVDAIRFDR